MLIIFTVKDQKVTHDLGKRTLVAGSSGIVQAAFTFDSSWDGLSIVVVFSNSAKKCSSKPVKYSGEPIDIRPKLWLRASCTSPSLGSATAIPERPPRSGTCNRPLRFSPAERSAAWIFSAIWLRVLYLTKRLPLMRRSNKCSPTFSGRLQNLTSRVTLRSAMRTSPPMRR